VRVIQQSGKAVTNVETRAACPSESGHAEMQ
jgi:hypothetical protein